MTKQDHPLFQEFPLSGERQISTGKVPVPYHIYDGYGLFIGGTADLSRVQDLLKNENVRPMQTRSGKAVMGIWVIDFNEASLGSHNELQFSILVSHEPAQPVEDHPLTFLKALFLNPKARMLCFNLWNNSQTAVAYNRELLGLPSQLSEGTIGRDNGRVNFHFNTGDGQMILQGDVSQQKRTSFGAIWSLIRLMGLRQSLRAQSVPYLEAKVVNPIGLGFSENLDAKTFLAADTPVIQLFEPDKDTLSFNIEYAERFQFQPQFLEHFSPFRFVYLPPG